MSRKRHHLHSRSLFVWRDKYGADCSGPYTGDEELWRGVPRPNELFGGLYAGFYTRCPFCKTEYETERFDPYPSSGAHQEKRCHICGFWWIRDYGNDGHWDSQIYEFAALQRLEINSSDLALEELGTHIRRRFGDIYHLTPRRFEELVADIYSNLGYLPRLTQHTRDGGYDIYMLEKSSKEQTIVKCKRYGKDRRLRVGTVRQVLGIQLETGIRQAKIVTTTSFTKPARDTANKVSASPSGYQLELIDAHELLTALGVYNAKLPPLHVQIERTLTSS